MTTTPPIYEAGIVGALRRIQTQHGYLERKALERLAKTSKTPLHRLQAVASFFPHFRLSPPPRLTMRVCRDMACHMAGSRQVLATLSAKAGDGIRVEGVSCLGRCDRPPAVCVEIHDERGGRDHETHGEARYFLGRTPAELVKVLDRFASGAEPAPAPDRDVDRPVATSQWTIDPYDGQSTYAAVKKAVAVRDEALARGERDWADALLDELDESHADLRGLGGAGIPATTKWRDVRHAVRVARTREHGDARAFVIVNADESEPGTFKDRELLLRCPHLIVEGLILAALATDATQGFVYIRHEYAEQIAAIEREIRNAERAGACGMNASMLGRPLPISVFESPGGYICGEQSALVEAMSDRRGEPRNLPPKLETNGLDDQPTLVSNVETYAWVPYIWLRGGAAYRALGTNGWAGRRFFSVSGDVVRPGVYEVPMGLTLHELIYGATYCGGIAGGKTLKAIAPSGPSGGFLPARLTAAAGLPRGYADNRAWRDLAARRGFDPRETELAVTDLELELALFRALSPTQALGAGIVVYAEGRDMADQAVNALEFFRNESCGKCVPCRIGSQKLAALGGQLLDGTIPAARWRDELLPLVGTLSEAMSLASICGLGRAVPGALKTAVDYFADDVAVHLGPATSPERRR